MKRFLLIFLIISSLILPAFAWTEADLDDLSYGDVYVKANKSSGSTLYYGLFSENWGIQTTGTINNYTFNFVMPVHLFSTTPYIYSFSWLEPFQTNSSAQVTIDKAFSSATVYFTDGTYTTLSALSSYNGLELVSGCSFFCSVENASASFSGYIRQMTCSFILSDPSIKCISVVTGTHKVDGFESGDFHMCKVSGAGYDDVLSTIKNSLANISSIATGLQQAASQTNTSLGILTNTLADRVVAAIEGAQCDEKADALADVDQAASDISAAVNDVMPDLTTAKQTLQTLYSNLTSHSTCSSITFPAGTCTISGQTYTFWNESTVDFSQIANNSSMQLILLPLRFILYLGSIKFIVDKIKALIDTFVFLKDNRAKEVE